jgi:hypothetical protein
MGANYPSLRIKMMHTALLFLTSIQSIKCTFPSTFLGTLFINKIGFSKIIDFSCVHAHDKPARTWKMFGPKVWREPKKCMGRGLSGLCYVCSSCHVSCWPFAVYKLMACVYLALLSCFLSLPCAILACWPVICRVSTWISTRVENGTETDGNILYHFLFRMSCRNRKWNQKARKRKRKRKLSKTNTERIQNEYVTKTDMSRNPITF